VDENEVLEHIAASKMTKRHLRVLLAIPNAGIGLCDLYVEVNPQMFYGYQDEEQEQADPPIEEAELRPILRSLLKADWITRQGHNYFLAEFVRNRVAELRPQMEADAEAQARQNVFKEASEAAEREEKAREGRARRNAQKAGYWKLLWERQSGKCGLCEKAIPEGPVFGPHMLQIGYDYEKKQPIYREEIIQQGPFIRHVKEVGDVLPCKRCYSRLAHVKTQDDFQNAKEYWRIVDAAIEANPGLISRTEAMKILRIGLQALQLLVVRGLAVQVIAGDMFFERADIERLSTETRAVRAVAAGIGDSQRAE
jgi:hypothetical protein